MLPHCAQVSTWKHLKGSRCTKSGNIGVQWSFTWEYIIPYTLHPIGPAPLCTWTSLIECLADPGLNFCRWNLSAPPSVSHWYTRVEMVSGIEPWHCHSTLIESQQCTLYFATLGCYFLPLCPQVGPNPSLVTCYLAFPFSPPPNLDLHLSWKISDESITHCQNYPTSASFQMSPKNLQPLSPSAGVHLAAVSVGLVPG